MTKFSLAFVPLLIFLAVAPTRTAWAAPPEADSAEPSPKRAEKESRDNKEHTAPSKEASAAALPEGGSPPPPKPLRVVVAGSPPFVEDNGHGAWTGPSVEVFHRAASQLHLEFEMTGAPSVDAALSQVERGLADVAVGPITITAPRAEKVAFTQPYFRSALGIAAYPENEFLSRFEPFLSVAFLTALGALLWVLSIVGLLMWFFERKKNPEQFPKKVLPGIGNGIWFALVTMTTVGYGDRAPQTLGGRIVAGGWMLVALITVSSLTAGIATALTLSQLGTTAVEKAGDLEGRRVATLRGTHAEAFVQQYGGRVIHVPDLHEALLRARAGQVDAVIFDRPALIQAISAAPTLDIKLSPRRYDEQGYGFAVPLHSQLANRLDVALLQDATKNEKLFEEFQGDE